MTTRPLLAGMICAALALAACGSDDDAAPAATGAPAATSATTATDPAAAGTTMAEAPPAYGGDTAPATSATDTDTASDTDAGTSADADATVMIATSDELGDYLVDGNGRTLYLFTQDDGTTTACTGPCVDVWPPMVAESPVAGEGADAALLATAEGIRPDQVTYNGHLMYFYAGDITPGDTNGVGLPDWYAVDPAGNAIE